MSFLTKQRFSKKTLEFDAFDNSQLDSFGSHCNFRIYRESTEKTVKKIPEAANTGAYPND